ncbi:hypothetical protein DFH27DRAFT_95674 [Peziza echinospora]|nr:hypothetical protein DFH27DRAFT_95674 [Peziza echinospora]
MLCKQSRTLVCFIRGEFDKSVSSDSCIYIKIEIPAKLGDQRQTETFWTHLDLPREQLNSSIISMTQFHVSTTFALFWIYSIRNCTTLQHCNILCSKTPSLSCMVSLSTSFFPFFLFFSSLFSFQKEPTARAPLFLHWRIRKGGRGW